MKITDNLEFLLKVISCAHESDQVESRIQYVVYFNVYNNCFLEKNHNFMFLLNNDLDFLDDDVDDEGSQRSILSHFLEQIIDKQH
jgi:hypothetical protein